MLRDYVIGRSKEEKHPISNVMKIDTHPDRAEQFSATRLR